jgi:hypothetical protein
MIQDHPRSQNLHPRQKRLEWGTGRDLVLEQVTGFEILGAARVCPPGVKQDAYSSDHEIRRNDAPEVLGNDVGSEPIERVADVNLSPGSRCATVQE